MLRIRVESPAPRSGNVTHNCLKLKLHGIGHALLNSDGTCNTRGIHTQWYIQTHIQKNKSLLKYISKYSVYWFIDNFYRLCPTVT